MYLNNPEVIYKVQMQQREELITSIQNSRLARLRNRQTAARKSFFKQVIVWIGYQMMARGYQLVRHYDLLTDEKSIPFPCG